MISSADSKTCGSTKSYDYDRLLVVDCEPSSPPVADSTTTHASDHLHDDDDDLLTGDLQVGICSGQDNDTYRENSRQTAAPNEETETNPSNTLWQR